MAARQTNLRKVIQAEKKAQEEYESRRRAQVAERGFRPEEMEKVRREEFSLRRVYANHDDVAKYPLTERSPMMRENKWWHKYNVPVDHRNPEITLQLLKCPGNNVSEVVADIADLYHVNLTMPAGGDVDLNILISSPEARTNKDWMLPYRVVDCCSGTPAFVVEPDAWFNYLSFWENVDGLRQDLDCRLAFAAVGNRREISTIPYEVFKRRYTGEMVKGLVASMVPGNDYPLPTIEEARLATQHNEQLLMGPPAVPSSSQTSDEPPQEEHLRGDMEDVDEVVRRNLTRRFADMGFPRTPKRQPSIETLEEMSMGARKKKLRMHLQGPTSPTSSTSSNATVDLEEGVRRTILESLDMDGDDMRSSRAINSALEDLFRREDEGTAFSSGVETIPLYSEMEKWMLTKRYKCISEAKAARGSPTSSSSSSTCSDERRTSPPILRSWSGTETGSPRASLSPQFNMSLDTDYLNPHDYNLGPQGDCNLGPQGSYSHPGSFASGIGSYTLMGSLTQDSVNAMMFVDDCSIERSPMPDLVSTNSSASIYSALSGLEELAISDDDSRDPIERLYDTDGTDAIGHLDEDDSDDTASVVIVDLTVKHNPGTSKQALGGLAKGELGRPEDPGTSKQALGDSAKGEPSQLDSEKASGVIPAGSEDDFGEEADLSSLFSGPTDTSYVFNDSVEVFLASKHNEDEIYNVSTGESSAADTTAPGDFMNIALMAEEEAAPNGTSEDELLEDDDDVPDLVIRARLVEYDSPAQVVSSDELPDDDDIPDLQ